jgi:hypothetical protein
MREAEPIQPNFEARKAFVEQLKPGDVVALDGVKIRFKSVNNRLFPFFIYGTDVQTGESRALRLQDESLPIVLEQVAEPPPTRSASMDREMQDAALAVGDPLFGLLVKLSAPGGMSSQLIKRSLDKRPGASVELLPGERDYEDARHELHVYYQTKNFVDIPPAEREQALREMRALSEIIDLKDRQDYALYSPLFGLRAK